MSYLISQTFILLLIAALLGMLLGTFLTRITAATSRAALQARLRNAETDARELRAELDVAVTARGACEAERKSLRERLDALETAPDARPIDADQPAPPPKVRPAPADSTVLSAINTGSDESDDLQRIKGIGPKIAGILQELGVRRFEQIAAWTPRDVARVNDHLRFSGRIEREQWVAQAQALLTTGGADS
ncbi:MAG: hypothetical protein H6960_01430 [Chromatiaceae bacterium]|nr:hypothetical protein [Chromatiaceae bacterium]MCP5436804.1 hypothetical protein [Chromatiaceae bacterium]